MSDGMTKFGRTKAVEQKPLVFKDDGTKLRMHLMPPEPVRQIVKVLEFGAKKYAANAWRDGIAWNRILDAAERHIAKWKEGDTYDDESGLNHLAHAACNLVFLLEYAKTHPELDDRYKPNETHRTLHDVLEGPCMCGAWHTEGK